MTHEFLMELIRRTGGNTLVSISMYEVGAAMGLEKSAAGKQAEELIAEGWAEIKTLSGAIAVTSEGLQAAGALAVHTDLPKPSMVLGSARIVVDEVRSEVEKLLQAIQESFNPKAMAYPQLEEMVLDLKTARVQLLSPHPKSAILREILRSLHNNLVQAGAEDIARRIAAFIKPDSPEADGFAAGKGAL